jgi:hypothetical protein
MLSKHNTQDACKFLAQPALALLAAEGKTCTISKLDDGPKQGAALQTVEGQNELAVTECHACQKPKR